MECEDPKGLVMFAAYLDVLPYLLLWKEPIGTVMFAGMFLRETHGS